MTLREKIAWHLNRKFYTVIFFFRFVFHPYATIRGIKIPVSYKWSYPMLQALFKRNYEGGELEIIAKTLEKNDRVLEIGTGLGLISTFCAKIVGSENVKTYEANPLLENRIQKLYQINQVSPELIISLVSDKEEIIKFYTEPKNIWASSLLKLSDTSIVMNLKTVDIKEIVAGYNPNYLIMDVEGAEYDLLPKIDLSAIEKIQIELHGKYLGVDKIDYLIKYLNRKGFLEIKKFSTDEQFFYLKSEN